MAGFHPSKPLHPRQIAQVATTKEQAMAHVAGVDSSTQSCKVVIRDAATGAAVASGRAPHPDGTEIHPDAWWDALLAAIADAGGLEGVGALAVAGQQHGM